MRCVLYVIAIRHIRGMRCGRLLEIGLGQRTTIPWPDEENVDDAENAHSQLDKYEGSVGGEWDWTGELYLYGHVVIQSVCEEEGV